MQENFYQYQHRRLGILLTWGLGIVIQGLWLLFYDGLLTIEVGQHWQQVEHLQKEG